MTTTKRRKCRKRCLGCDPCWICRKSYPASVSIAYSGGSSGGGSSGGSGDIWLGCCGYAQGTYVPATPYGPSAGFDNGVTVHHTFRDPATYGSVGVSQIGGICTAGWMFKRTLYRLRASYDYAGPLIDVDAVALCNGVDEESWWPDATDCPTATEILKNLEVSVHVGTYIGLGDSTIAAQVDSTQVTVRIMEWFAGNQWVTGCAFGDPFGSARRARYEVIRIQRYSTHLPKPCPKTGTFEVPYFGTSLITPLGPAVVNFGGLTAVLPPCVAATGDYSVSVTI